MINTLVVAIISFALGNVSGFLVNKFLTNKVVGFDADARINFLVIIVTMAWLLSVIVDLLSVGYETPIQIHLLMGAIVGYFFYRPGGHKK